MMLYGNIEMHSEYQEEIYQTLRERELRSRAPFLYQSPQLGCRRRLLVLLKALAIRLKLREPAVHLAALFLDRFMDHHSVDAHRLDLLVAVCLLIAAKVEIIEAKVPFVSQLCILLCRRHSALIFVYLERMIVSFFDWTLMLPTAAHFVELLLPSAIADDDLSDPREGEDPPSLRLLRAECHQLVWAFLEAGLHEVRLHDFPASRVAAACLLAARCTLRLRDPWPPRLERLSGLAAAELQSCLDVILLHRRGARKRRVATSPDGGYASDASALNSLGGKRANLDVSPSC